jgi:hypothetical protein
MVAISTMRRVWMLVSLSVALLSFYPAWMGGTSWWLPGLSITFFLIFLLEPLMLTWELRKSGNQLQITDEGVLRRLPRAENEYVRWDDLREVSVVTTQNAGAAEDYFYVLAGSGKSGVLVSQALAARHDLLSHLSKLPGFDHRGVADAMHASGAQRFVLWRSRTFSGEATVIPMNRIEPPSNRLH